MATASLRPDPSAESASMVTVPFFFPVTTPFASTVATCSFLDRQVTSKMLALAGDVSAFRARLRPMPTVFPSGLVTFTFVTGWITSTRNTCRISGFCSLWTVRSHSPAWIALAEVFPAFSTPSSEEMKSTFRLLASSGVQVARSSTDLPAGITITSRVVSARSRSFTAGSSGR